MSNTGAMFKAGTISNGGHGLARMSRVPFRSTRTLVLRAQEALAMAQGSHLKIWKTRCSCKRAFTNELGGGGGHPGCVP